MWYMEPVDQSLLSLSGSLRAWSPVPDPPHPRGRDAKVPCPLDLFPGCPPAMLWCQEGAPFNTWPSLSCPHETPHPAHSGGPEPPGLYASPCPAAQAVPGGLPWRWGLGCPLGEFRAAALCTRSRVTGLTAPPPTSFVPGVQRPIPGSPRGGSCSTRDLGRKSAGLPQTSLSP